MTVTRVPAFMETRIWVSMPGTGSNSALEIAEIVFAVNATVEGPDEVEPTPFA